MNWILPSIWIRLPEGLVIFYQTNRANIPPGLIQDQPRGLFTDCLLLQNFNKDRSLPSKNRKQKNKDKGMRRNQTTTPRPSPPRLVGSYPGAGLLSQSKTVKDDF